jgi:hypothetical protein
MAQSEFAAALESGDVRLVRRASARMFPHMPQPKTVEDAEVSMHMARTQMAEISFRARAWSHAWLRERGLPSQLPDELRPKAERVYPVVVSAVFVSANSNSPALKPVAKLVQAAMSDAVLEAEADGRLLDTPFVRARIQEARARTFKQLLGTTGGI